MHPIEFSHVWKRYRIGSKHDSLRDAIPAFLKRCAGRNGHGLEEGEFWALKDVTFAVEPAETLGIIGPNGAGKSTALKLLSKISKQTKGDIRTHGRLAALIEVGAGFHQDLTGRENIYLNGTIMGMRHKELDRLFDSIVEFSELEKFLDMPVKRYSSGMTARLGFAVAAHMNPDVLLVDEVLAVGDLSFQQKCYQRILDLKAQGTTIVFISHNLEAVQRLCDRVLLLHEGSVVKEGDPSDVIAYYRQEVLRKQRFIMKKSLGGSQVAIRTSDDVELTAARLLGADGRVREAFETNQPMHLELSYRTKRPITNPSVTITIERFDGLICHETSSRLADCVWGVWDGEGSFVLDYAELNLLPNTYQVVVSVCEGQNPTPLVHLRNQLYFQVTSRQRTRGTVYLKHHWRANHAAQPSRATA
ncbi:MAG: ABC transporter ATP-binding protein [Candidatus Omnitrophota bacterium]|nr:ABC transporter ATP-binding protein [Candidatus Omnitrophota bacterium]